MEGGALHGEALGWGWILPLLSNSWIINIIWLYISCYWGEQYPRLGQGVWDSNVGTVRA